MAAVLPVTPEISVGLVGSARFFRHLLRGCPRVLPATPPGRGPKRISTNDNRGRDPLPATSR
ncbi:hypothetical protein [Streptosporangium vulgare]|uniref:hypothetical protein n=1 Tax=Streptosporangium vulgare TaxID=46190 RepID=UPI0031D8FC11